MAGKTKAQLLAKRKPSTVRRLYDPKILAKELREWVKDEDAINMSGFCADRGYLPQTIWKIEQEDEDFAHALAITKMKLAERRERLLNCEMLNYGAWARYQKDYDPFLSKHEDDEKDKDAARKKGVVETEQANLFLLAKLASEGKISQK